MLGVLKVKKLVTVLATSTPVTVARKKAVGENLGSNLAWVPCIWYPITFWKKSGPVVVLFDSGSKINAIHPTFAKKLSLPIILTDIGIQKIDTTMLDIFGMVVTAFSMTDEANWVKFFKKIFLVANVSLKVVLGMSFLTLNSVDVYFLS